MSRSQSLFYAGREAIRNSGADCEHMEHPGHAIGTQRLVPHGSAVRLCSRQSGGVGRKEAPRGAKNPKGPRLFDSCQHKTFADVPHQVLRVSPTNALNSSRTLDTCWISLVHRKLVYFRFLLRFPSARLRPQSGQVDVVDAAGPLAKGSTGVGTGVARRVARGLRGVGCSQATPGKRYERLCGFFPFAFCSFSLMNWGYLWDLNRFDVDLQTSALLACWRGLEG